MRSKKVKQLKIICFCDLKEKTEYVVDHMWWILMTWYFSEWWFRRWWCFNIALKLKMLDHGGNIFILKFRKIPIVNCNELVCVDWRRLDLKYYSSGVKQIQNEFGRTKIKFAAIVNWILKILWLVNFLFWKCDLCAVWIVDWLELSCRTACLVVRAAVSIALDRTIYFFIKYVMLV